MSVAGVLQYLLSKKLTSDSMCDWKGKSILFQAFFFQALRLQGIKHAMQQCLNANCLYFMNKN